MKSLSRYKRVLQYIEELESRKPKGKSKELEELHKKLKHTGYKLRTLETIRTISFILLYSSITSAIISAIPGFEAFSKNIIRLSTLIGSTIFLIIVGITTKLIAVYTADLYLVSSHIISIHNK